MNPENFEDGYFLVSRSIMGSEVFHKEKWLKFFIWCLSKARFKDGTAEIKTGKSTTIVKLKRGQFIFGRKSAAKKLKFPASTCRNLLEIFCKREILDTQKDTHYTIVTVVNYDDYQISENYKGHPKGQAKDTQRTPKGHPKDTNNNVKNGKNEKKEYSEDSNEFRLSLFLFNNIRKRKPDYKQPDFQKWSIQSNYILRIDKRDINEVKAVIKWCQTDEFWQDNILSTAKLRKQYDKLVLKMNKATTVKTQDNGSQQARQEYEETMRMLDE